MCQRVANLALPSQQGQLPPLPRHSFQALMLTVFAAAEQARMKQLDATCASGRFDDGTHVVSKRRID
jgi:hypothetical protein